jgi:Haem-degrading
MAYGKAYAALSLGRSSKLVRERAQERPIFMRYLIAASGEQIFPEGGGMLIRNSSGEVIGAVGVTGDTEDRDEERAWRSCRGAEDRCRLRRDGKKNRVTAESRLTFPARGAARKRCTADAGSFQIRHGLRSPVLQCATSCWAAPGIRRGGARALCKSDCLITWNTATGRWPSCSTNG